MHSVHAVGSACLLPFTPSHALRLSSLSVAPNPLPTPATSMKQLARMDSALPLGPNTYYEGDEDASTWDEEKVFGCLCDSSWTVGLGAGERQEPEWFGPDCSQRHCPSADNPRTFRVETNCTGVIAKNSIYKGAEGNICQVRSALFLYLLLLLLLCLSCRSELSVTAADDTAHLFCARWTARTKGCATTRLASVSASTVSLGTIARSSTRWRSMRTGS